jgi:hypothetical protein
LNAWMSSNGAMFDPGRPTGHPAQVAADRRKPAYLEIYMIFRRTTADGDFVTVCAELALVNPESLP